MLIRIVKSFECGLQEVSGMQNVSHEFAADLAEVFKNSTAIAPATHVSLHVSVEGVVWYHHDMANEL